MPSSVTDGASPRASRRAGKLFTWVLGGVVAMGLMVPMASSAIDAGDCGAQTSAGLQVQNSWGEVPDADLNDKDSDFHHKKWKDAFGKKAFNLLFDKKVEDVWVDRGGDPKYTSAGFLVYKNRALQLVRNGDSLERYWMDGRGNFTRAFSKLCAADQQEIREAIQRGNNYQDRVLDDVKKGESGWGESDWTTGEDAWDMVEVMRDPAMSQALIQSLASVKSWGGPEDPAVYWGKVSDAIDRTPGLQPGQSRKVYSVARDVHEVGSGIAEHLSKFSAGKRIRALDEAWPMMKMMFGPGLAKVVRNGVAGEIELEVEGEKSVEPEGNQDLNDKGHRGGEVVALAR